MNDMDGALQRLRTAATGIVAMASDAQTHWVQLQNDTGQLADFRQLAEDVLAAYEREHAAKRRVLRDIAVCDSLDTINVYLSAMLLEVFIDDAMRRADAVIEAIVLR